MSGELNPYVVLEVDPRGLLYKRGINFAFGTFESFYALTYIPSFTASSISWIGTIQSWLLIACGIFSGPLFDRGHYAVMLLSGSVLAVFGFMMLSLSHKYYEIFLSQGVCMGLGFDCYTHQVLHWSVALSHADELWRWV